MSDKHKILAIIQARIGSTRLPGKVLRELEGKTVLERVIERVSASRCIDQVVVATTDKRDDLKLVEICERIGTGVFCGSENDVLDRYYKAADFFGACQVVRITSDCPLMDPRVIDAVVGLHREKDADYTSNTLKETFPDGEDVEVMSFLALEKAWKEAELASEREHVTPYLRKHPELFKHASLVNGTDLSKKRWTLDNWEDYLFIQRIFKELHGKKALFGMEEVLSLLAEHPEIEEMNHHIGRNEGMAKSLREDRIVRMGVVE